MGEAEAESIQLSPQQTNKIRREKIVFYIVLFLFIIGVGIVLYGLYLRGYMSPVISLIISPTPTATNQPTQTATLLPTDTLKPTSTNTPEPTLVPTKTSTPIPSPTLNERDVFIEECLEDGEVNYIVTGKKREKVYLTWINGGSDSDNDVFNLPICKRFFDFPSGAPMLVRSKAYDTSIEMALKCLIYEKGELVAEDISIEAGGVVTCKATTQ